MDRIELVGMGGDDAALDRLFQPGPLEHRRLENRGRRIGVIFEEFRRTGPVESEVEPAVEAGFIAAPALGDQRPEGFRYFQPTQVLFVVDRKADEFEAHAIDFSRWVLRSDVRFRRA